MSIRLVIADDHPIVLDGLEGLFKLERDLEVVARCVDAEETMQALRLHRPDVLLLDMHMPRGEGLRVLAQMRDEGLTTRPVILAASLEDAEVVAALGLGARGIVLKEVASQQVVQCVRKVFAGEQWVEPRASGRAMEALRRREAGTRESAKVLTPREIEMVRLVAGGLRNKEIAERVHITEGTVKIHLHNIYRKLEVQSRVELVLYAQASGLA